jgi:hypothetical protein
MFSESDLYLRAIYAIQEHTLPSLVFRGDHFEVTAACLLQPVSYGDSTDVSVCLVPDSSDLSAELRSDHSLLVMQGRRHLTDQPLPHIKNG